MIDNLGEETSSVLTDNETLDNQLLKLEGLSAEELLESLFRQVQTSLKDSNYRQNLHQEVEVVEGEKVYTPYIKSIFEQHQYYINPFTHSYEFWLKEETQLCPDSNSRDIFSQDLSLAAFREFIRHSQDLAPHERNVFIKNQIDTNALMFFQHHWLDHPLARESFLKYLVMKVKTFQRVPQNGNGWDASLIHHKCDPYYPVFINLFTPDFQQCEAKWPDELDKEEIRLHLEWDVFRTFLHYCGNPQHSYTNYVKKIIKTRSINIIEQKSPRAFQCTPQSLRSIESILSIEISLYINELHKKNVASAKWIPTELQPLIPDTPTPPGKKTDIRALIQFKQAMSQFLVKAIMTQLRNSDVTRQTCSRKTDFLEYLKTLMGKDLTQRFGQMIAVQCTSYRRHQQQSVDEETQEQGIDHYLEFSDPSWRLDAMRQSRITNPEQDIARKDSEVYKQTFLQLMESRPYEEQFLLKRKAEYKPAKKPKTIKPHELDHPQRRSYDEILELVHLNPKRYPMFYQYYRTKSKENTKFELPISSKWSASWYSQEFYPLYFFLEVMEDIGIDSNLHSRLVKYHRVAARLKISKKALSSLDFDEIPNIAELRSFENRQFEKPLEFLQFVRPIIGKEALNAFKELLVNHFKLPKKEPLCLKRSHTRLWAERILEELRQMFLKFHPETDVQIKDLLVTLHDLEEL